MRTKGLVTWNVKNGILCTVDCVIKMIAKFWKKKGALKYGGPFFITGARKGSAGGSLVVAVLKNSMNIGHIELLFLWPRSCVISLSTEAMIHFHANVFIEDYAELHFVFSLEGRSWTDWKCEGILSFFSFNFFHFHSGCKFGAISHVPHVGRESSLG